MSSNDYGIKWVKDNADVDTAGLEDTILTSQFPLLKVKVEGSGSINYDNDGSDNDTLIATHSLGYEPLVDFMIEWYDVDSASKQSDYRPAPLYDGQLADLGIYFLAKNYVNTTQLRLNVSSFDGNGGNFTLNYYYRVYYDPDDNP